MPTEKLFTPGPQIGQAASQFCDYLLHISGGP
jgi:hypothetical protein